MYKPVQVYEVSYAGFMAIQWTGKNEIAVQDFIVKGQQDYIRKAFTFRQGVLYNNVHQYIPSEARMGFIEHVVPVGSWIVLARDTDYGAEPWERELKEYSEETLREHYKLEEELPNDWSD